MERTGAVNDVAVVNQFTSELTETVPVSTDTTSRDELLVFLEKEAAEDDAGAEDADEHVEHLLKWKALSLGCKILTKRVR